MCYWHESKAGKGATIYGEVRSQMVGEMSAIKANARRREAWVKGQMETEDLLIQ